MMSSPQANARKLKILWLYPARITPFALTVCALTFAAQGAAGADDIALGEYLSGECVTCHQLSGQTSGIPPIIGWPKDAFTTVLNAYKTGERSNEVMKTIAARLSETEIKALAAYFASLSPKRSQTTPAK